MATVAATRVHPGARRHRLAPLYAGLAVFAVVLLARLAYIHALALPVPFWDQWDAEGAGLLLPLADGNLGARDLFSAHNEHRILWSRLLSLLMFAIGGGEWNNATLAMASSVVIAGALGLMCLLAWRHEQARPPRLAILAAACAVGVLPFAWENILFGFQSQFYFLALFGMITIATATLAERTLAMALAIPLALAAVFTMASGLIGVAAAALVLMLRVHQDRTAWDARLAIAFALLGIAAWAYGLVPRLDKHAELAAQGLRDLSLASMLGLSWPATGRWLFVLLWAPAVVAGLMALRRQLPAKADLFMFGLALLAAGQALAIATSRGHGMASVSSRYMELLALGVAANAWFLARATSAAWAKGHRARLALLGFSFLWCAGTLGALVARTPADVGMMLERHALACRHQYNVGRFLNDADPRHLDKPFLEIPYPDAERLATLLQQPAIARSLAHVAAEPRNSKCAAAILDEIPFPVARQDVGTAVPLAPGSSVALRADMQDGGRLTSLQLLLGTYGGASDGYLVLEACTHRGRECGHARVDLASASDNRFLALGIEPALVLQPGDLLEARLSLVDATHPVAIWANPAGPRSLRIGDGDDAPGARARATLAVDGH